MHILSTYMYPPLTHMQQPRRCDNTRLHTTLHDHPSNILAVVDRWQLYLAASCCKHATRTPDARSFRPTITSSLTQVTRNVPGIVATTNTRSPSYIDTSAVVHICLKLHSTNDTRKTNSLDLTSIATVNICSAWTSPYAHCETAQSQ